MSERAKEFWTCEEDPEQLYHVDISEAVVEFCEDILPGESVPETVVVYRYVPMDPPKAEEWARGHHVERLLEDLDEEYGNPNDYTRPTEAMKAAEVEFVRAVLAEYRTWACKPAGSETVRVLDHVTAEWLAPLLAPTPAEQGEP